jgi:tRNA (adenine22-N1)-methyltransferase
MKSNAKNCFKLSNRLKAIGDFVEAGETVADIGSDHAKLPIYLIQEGISPFVILSDLRPGPILKARQNTMAYAPELQFDVRMGDGLSSVMAGEVDVIILAGMGGLLIINILKAAGDKTKSFKKLILQPRRDKGLLARWLMTSGFVIVDEALVQEGTKISEIIVATPFLDDKNGPSDGFNNSSDYDISPILIKKNEPLFHDLISHKILIEKQIIENLEKARHSSFNFEKQDSARARLDRLTGLLSRLQRSE